MKRLVDSLSLAVLAWSVLVCAGAADAHAQPDGAKREAPVEPVAAREIVISGHYVDAPVSQIFDPLALITGTLEKEQSFFELCQELDRWSRVGEPKIALLNLASPSLRMNHAQVAEFRRHLNKLRTAGVRSIAWLEEAGPTHYSIASACDEILQGELAILDFPSLSLTSVHFRDALDLLGIEASFARSGDFKGATEPFTRSEMSPGLRQHYHDLLVALNDAWLKEIAATRTLLSVDKLRECQRLRLFSARDALAAGLIDGVAELGEPREATANHLGRPVRWLEKSTTAKKQPSLFELLSKVILPESPVRAARPSIVILHLNGPIVDGAADRPGVVVAGPIVEQIRELTRDAKVRGVVVRLDSPGGSVTASETIRHALERLAEKKPVVVTMGSMATSGGYWISCAGAHVLAEEQTITGSIGVFALKLSAGPLLRKVGVRLETVALDESARAMALDRAWTAREQERIQEVVGQIDSRFLELVAQSRNLDSTAVDELAGGRIWSGTQALELGLIDELGGIDIALERVRQRAGGGPDVEIIHVPRPKSFFEMLDIFDPSAGVQLSKPELRHVLPLLETIGWAPALRAVVADSSGYTGTRFWLIHPMGLAIR